MAAKGIAVTLLVLVAACIVSAGPQSAALAKKVIFTDEINSHYIVMGPLGIPLGEVATVEGVARINNSKGHLEWLDVSTVNGKPLARPVSMHYLLGPFTKLEKLKEGAHYRLLAYQAGEFSGIPRNGPSELSMVQDKGFGFETTLSIVGVPAEFQKRTAPPVEPFQIDPN